MASVSGSNDVGMTAESTMGRSSGRPAAARNGTTSGPMASQASGNLTVTTAAAAITATLAAIRTGTRNSRVSLPSLCTCRYVRISPASMVCPRRYACSVTNAHAASATSSRTMPTAAHTHASGSRLGTRTR